VLGLRDLEYVENRLTAPVTDLLDAIERLRRCGKDEQAERLMRAAQELTDECRAVRHELVHEEGRNA
jgi:hypothetical protein